MEQEIAEAIQYFKTMAPEAWAIMVRGQIIQGIFYTLGGLFSLLAFGLVMHERYIREAEWAIDSRFKGHPSDVWVAVALVTAVLALGGLIALFIAPQYMIAPEYFALKELMP